MTGFQVTVIILHFGASIWLSLSFNYFFSRSVAKAFGYHGETDKEDIVLIINDGFDVLNSSHPRHPYVQLKSGLGMTTIFV